jgi:hypothetical protein
MNRPDPAYLIEITDAAPLWLRRCSDSADEPLPGLPREGIAVSSVSLRVALAAGAVTGISVDAEGRIRWRAAGRCFNAEPVREPPDVPA